MSKYDEIYSKIDALNDGWNKEADDVLREMSKGKYGPALQISFVHAGGDAGIGDVRIYDKSEDIFKPDEFFRYNSQCEKMSAFKKALHCLLDHSDIKKDEKGDKIKELQEKQNRLQEQQNELREQIAELR